MSLFSTQICLMSTFRISYFPTSTGYSCVRVYCH